MEHVIQEHTLEYPEAHKGERVLHCMSCDDWVSIQDTPEVVAEFKNAACPGPRQHEDNDEILPTTSGKLTDDGGAVYKDNFYQHPDFKKEDRT